ncbi:MAG: cadherin-like beta sandwich domain-containing protein [Spirochaetaceae bacterium]|nr:cadherin-like beta sandwich domain-containing protein [Spirochaetaceae bacterium]
MKNLTKLGGVALALWLVTAFGCNQTGLLDDIFAFGGKYKISVAPGAVSQVFADKESANEQQTVTVWTVGNKKPVVRIDDPEITDTITVMGGSVIDDQGLLDKLGVSSLRAWSFQMPASNVTLAIDSGVPDDSNTFLKSLKIEKAVAEGSPEDLVVSIGAPSPALDEFQVPAETEFNIYLTYAKGVAISYKVGAGAKTDLTAEEEGQGMFYVPPITTGQAVTVEIYAQRNADTPLEYTYVLNTVQPAASVEAGLQSLEVKAIEKVAAPATGLVKTYTVENNVASVDIVAVTKHAKATLTINGGVMLSNIPAVVSLSKMGDGEANYNTFKIIATAEDKTTNTIYTINIIRKKSSNSALVSLAIDEVGDFGFLASNHSYDLTNHKLSSFNTVARITPRVADPNAKLYFNGGLVESGVTQNFPLQNTGTVANVVSISVKAQDETSTLYAVNLYREPDSGEENPDATEPVLANIVLKEPAISSFVFNKGTLEYDLKDSPVTESSIIIVPTAGDEKTSILVNSTLVDNNSETKVNLLNTGATPNTITVSVGNVINAMTLYTINIYRTADANARLSSLTLTAPPVSFAMNPDGGTYAVTVPNDAGSIKITAVPQSSGATMTLNSVSMPANEAQIYTFTGYGPTNVNEAVIVVTAQDGVTKITHTLQMTRAIGSNPDLKDLNVNGGGLIVTGFNAALTSYELNSQTMPLEYRVRQISVTPTAKSATSSITINRQIIASGGTFIWDLAASNNAPALENKLNIVVTAQDGTEKTYTLKVWRARNSGDNALLKSITTSVDGKIDYGARVYPRIIPGVTEYKLYAPVFKDKTITISATPEDPDAVFAVVNGTVAFTEEPKPGWGYWDEVPLSPPIEITVTAVDDITTKTYYITHVVLTPGEEWGKTPMAKGGTITFLDAGSVEARDELHVWSTGQKETLASNLLFLGGTPASLPSTGWVLVQGGGGHGGKRSYEYGYHKGGGGGGGAGSVVEKTAYSIVNYDYVVTAGKGGLGVTENSNAADSIGYGDNGESSKFGSVVAFGGGGGTNGNSTGRMVSGNIGDMTLNFLAIGLEHDESKPTKGGNEGCYESYWDLSLGLASAAAAPIMAYCMAYGLSNGNVFGHLNPTLQTFYHAPAIALIGGTLFSGLALCASVWFGHCVGAAGGGGAVGNGSTGEYHVDFPSPGGKGGSGFTSSITGTAFEYGKGGNGGESFSSGAHNGQGGNAEYITETNQEKDGYQQGGNGKVVFRAVWK